MSQKNLKIAISQLNSIVGDFENNIHKIYSLRQKAANECADLIVFNEFSLSGTPLEQLVLDPTFLELCRKAISSIALQTADSGPAVLIGVPWLDQGKIKNAMIFMVDGEIHHVIGKSVFPENGLYQESFLYKADQAEKIIRFRNFKIGLLIGEELYSDNLVKSLSQKGADFILAPQAQAYWRGRFSQNLNTVKKIAQEHKLPVAVINAIGGQDDLVFDGASFIITEDGQNPVLLKSFQEDNVTTQWTYNGSKWTVSGGEYVSYPEDAKADYHACMLGLRDYIKKNGFRSVVLGMSGGIDSALVAALAVDAIGAQNVYCIRLPSQFSSQGSLDDAEDCVRRLKAHLETIPISSVVSSLEDTLKPLFDGRSIDVTEENLQARSRGILLMALSNKFGHLLLSTGNKSEGSVGYATLYGDMCGGFNPITDLYKTRVYELCQVRNMWIPDDAHGPSGKVIPQNIINKAPSAELREGQKDQDSLPPYDILDAILIKWVEERYTIPQITAAGFNEEIVRKVIRLVNGAEYKRQQAVFGPKLTKVSYIRDRKVPTTHHFKG